MSYWRQRASEILEARSTRDRKREHKLYHGISTWDYVFTSGLFDPEIAAELGYNVNLGEFGEFAFKDKTQRREYYSKHFKIIGPWLAAQLAAMGIKPYSGSAIIYGEEVKELSRRALQKGGTMFRALARSLSRIAETQ